MLPFTRKPFIAVVADDNAAVWPMQVAAYLPGPAAVAAVLRPSPGRSRFVTGAPAAMRVWPDWPATRSSSR